MKRSLFLLIAGSILLAFSLFFNLAPEKMLSGSKIEVNYWTVAFARTSGIFIGCFGLLSLLVRNAEDSPALRAILLTTAAMMLLTAGLDAYIRISGTEVKNNASVIMRLLLSGGYLYYFFKSSPFKSISK